MQIGLIVCRLNRQRTNLICLFLVLGPIFLWDSILTLVYYRVLDDGPKTSDLINMAMLKGCVSAICNILPTNINLLGYNVSTIIYHRYKYVDKNYIFSVTDYIYILFFIASTKLYWLQTVARQKAQKMCRAIC